MTAFLQLVGQVQGPFLGANIHPSQPGTRMDFRGTADGPLFEDVEPDEHPVYIDQPLTLTSGKCLFGYEEDSRCSTGLLLPFIREIPPPYGPTGTGKTTIIRLILAFGLSGKRPYRFND